MKRPVAEVRKLNWKHKQRKFSLAELKGVYHVKDNGAMKYDKKTEVSQVPKHFTNKVTRRTEAEDATPLSKGNIYRRTKTKHAKV